MMQEAQIGLWCVIVLGVAAAGRRMEDMHDRTPESPSLLAVTWSDG